MIYYRTYTSKGRDRRIRLYNIWRAMRKRCVSESCIDYPAYGGRGIAVCDEWEDYLRFRKWAINNGYRKGLTIDRIDNDGDYSPTNCKWSTPKEQRQNQRVRSNAIMVKWKGRTVALYELSKKYGMPAVLVAVRYRAGWSVKDALTRPILKRSSTLQTGQKP